MLTKCCSITHALEDLWKLPNWSASIASRTYKDQALRIKLAKSNIF